MNIHDLTVNHLKRAAAIKEQIERLTREPTATLGVVPSYRAAPIGTMSASTKERLRLLKKTR